VLRTGRCEEECYRISESERKQTCRLCPRVVSAVRRERIDGDAAARSAVVPRGREPCGNNQQGLNRPRSALWGLNDPAKGAAAESGNAAGALPVGGGERVPHVAFQWKDDMWGNWGSAPGFPSIAAARVGLRWRQEPTSSETPGAPQSQVGQMSLLAISRRLPSGSWK
jgi:hypothetical protein